jgi:type IV pilus assembly protein PilY1
VGDLNGNLYGFKFNFHDHATRKGIWIDRWLTKGVDESSAWPWSLFRSQAQPMTVQPVASLDRNDEDKLRVLFGAGKYDDVITGDDDKTDPLKTSIYNLADPITLPDLTLTTAPDPSAAVGGQIIDGSGLYVYIYPRCGPANLSSRLAKFYNSQTDANDRACTWVREFTTVTAGDCCEKTSAQCDENRTNPCWDCVLDLLLPDSGDAHQETGAQTGDPGERVTNKGLIAGGLFFVTTYVPNADPCKYLGAGYLYILDYACQPFPKGFNPLNDPRFTPVYFFVQGGGGSDPAPKYGLRLGLGQGLPSNPVLDSSGEHVIIQMSTGEILRIGVNLLEDPINLRGWREEEQGD